MEKAKQSDFLVVNLKPMEIDNPYLVLAEFFNDDWLAGHLGRLHKWRECILNNFYFKGDKGSPAELLYFHRINVCLLEVAYLLKDKPELIEGLNLETEKKSWRDYPNNLTNKELINPTILLHSIFEDYDLIGYREILYEWLEHGLSSSAANEFIETADLIKVYENLQKLYSVAWLLHQRSADEPYLKEDDEQTNSVSEDPGINVTKQPNIKITADLYNLDSAISLHQQELISELVAIIKHKVPSVQVITYLGTSTRQPDNIFLLVLLGSEEQRHAQCLVSMIEESCLKAGNVTALVHHAFTVLKNATDNLFFNKALSCPTVYLSGDILLPNISQLNDNITAAIIMKWERWFEQGKDFYKGAGYYLQIGAGKAALFSLHQSAECLLIAILRTVTGYSINNHNLDRLLLLTQMFTMDIANVFDLSDEGNTRLFSLLKHAYVNVRYKDTFELDIKDVNTLYLCIGRLIAVSESVYQIHALTCIL